MKTIKLAFSSCPNDTFIFDALAHGKIDTARYDFEIAIADIKELNALARAESVDLCKVSYFTYAQLADRYTLLQSGGALGQGCGPLLISKRPIEPNEIPKCRIGIPGADTTANFLLNFYEPSAQNKQVFLFHEIMPALERGEIDLGVIIHESRFVYPQQGLLLVQDLGEFWEKQTGLPIPLGGIVAHKRLGAEIINDLDRLVRQSVEYAFANPNASADYVRSLAQEMDEEVMKAHIGLYVNQYSIDLGDSGNRAVDFLVQAVKNKA